MSHIAETRRLNGSVLKALSVLDAFGPQRDQLNGSQLAEITGLSRGSLYPIIHSLETGGYLQRVAPRTYSVGFRVVELANVVLRRLDIQESVRPALQRLASTLKVNAHLGVLNGHDALHLYREIGADAVVVGEIVGWQAPAYCTALGKVLLAHLPGRELDAFLASAVLVPHTPTTITNATQLADEIRSIAEIGHAVSQEEYHEGVVGIAAAVRDAQGVVCCAISVSVTKPRFDREERTLVDAVRQAAASISDQLRLRTMVASASSQTDWLRQIAREKKEEHHNGT